MTSSLAACLHSVGFEMPCVHDVVPLVLIDVDDVVEALTESLQIVGFWQSVLLCVVLVQGVVSCTYKKWFKP